jgi:hypothetical protein
VTSPLPDPTDALAERVTHLERRARLAVAVAAVAVVLAGIAAAVAAVALRREGSVDRPTIGSALIEASEVVLRDERGDLRGRWTVQGLSLADQTGRLRASINTGPDGTPNIALFGKEGRTRAVLGLGAEDAPAMTLHDGKSGVRVKLAVDGEAAPSLTLSNEKGDVVAQLPAPPATKPVTAPRTDRSR